MVLGAYFQSAPDRGGTTMILRLGMGRKPPPHKMIRREWKGREQGGIIVREFPKATRRTRKASRNPLAFDFGFARSALDCGASSHRFRSQPSNRHRSTGYRRTTVALSYRWVVCSKGGRRRSVCGQRVEDNAFHLLIEACVMSWLQLV